MPEWHQWRGSLHLAPVRMDGLLSRVSTPQLAGDGPNSRVQRVDLVLHVRDDLRQRHDLLALGRQVGVYLADVLGYSQLNRMVWR